jgi:predicted component of type VI protein secretion system
MSRMDPLAIDDDLSDFAPRQMTEAAKPIASDVIDEISRASGFPSRQPAKKKPVASPEPQPRPQPQPQPQRRYVTGRNQQVNIKAKSETIALLNQLADEMNVPLGEVLERSLSALVISRKSQN